MVCSLVLCVATTVDIVYLCDVVYVIFVLNIFVTHCLHNYVDHVLCVSMPVWKNIMLTIFFSLWDFMINILMAFSSIVVYYFSGGACNYCRSWRGVLSVLGFPATPLVFALFICWLITWLVGGSFSEHYYT